MYDCSGYYEQPDSIDSLSVLEDRDLIYRDDDDMEDVDTVIDMPQSSYEEIYF